MLTGVLARLRALLLPGTTRDEIDEELRSHCDREIERLIASGMSLNAAVAAAQHALGNATLHRENAREAYGWRWLDELRQDLRYALRNMGRAPALTAVIVAILAMGIGPNAALISYLDARLADAGAVDANGLVRVSFRTAQAPGTKLTADEFGEFSRRQQWFESVARTVQKRAAVTIDGAQSTVDVQLATGSYFHVLGLRLPLGAAIPAIDDHAPDPPRVAVASFRFWQTALRGSPGAIGRTVNVNGIPITIVGVMPKDFDAPELTLPYATRRALSLDETESERNTTRQWDGVLGRLRPDVRPAQAQAGSTAIAAAIRKAGDPFGLISRATLSPFVLPGRFGFAMQRSAPLSIVSLLILLIGCANVSILLIGRAVNRRREIAVRLSLGASRIRIVRQLLTESVLLALMACAAGVLLLVWASKILWLRYPAVPDLAPRWSAAGATMAFSVLTGMLFGLLPALHATRTEVGDALKDGIAGLDVRRARLQRAFVIAEVALSITLVCATGLFLNGFRGMMAIHGYAASPRVLLTDLDFSSAHYSAARQAAFLDEVKANIAHLQGVRTVGFSDGVPLSPEMGHWGLGVPATAGMRFGAINSRVARITLIDSAFFEAMGIAVTSGRDVSRSDSAGGPRVAIISHDIADSLWPGASPLGKVVRIRKNGRWLDSHHFSFDTLQAVVIGVTAPIEQEALLDATSPLSGQARSTRATPPDRSMIFLARSQWPDSGNGTLIVQSARPDPALALAIEQDIRAADPRLPFTPVISAEAYQRAPFKGIDAAVNGLTWSGALALLLACVGIYAVIAFAIGQRTREIGIRIALGARAGQVAWLFFRDGLALSIAGIAIGVPLALLIMRLMVVRELGPQMLAPLAVVWITAGLVGVAALASWLPARRAAAVDPLTALRSE